MRKRKGPVAGIFIAVMLLLFYIPILSSCGGGGGGSTPVRVAVLGDYNTPEIADFLQSKGAEVDNFSFFQSYSPLIDGNIIVWVDDRNGDGDIYAYDLSTDTEFRVNQDATTAYQNSPRISGNIIVWVDWRNGDPDIYAYDLSTNTEFRVNQDGGNARQSSPAIEGNIIAWVDQRNGNDDIYAYNLVTEQEFKVNQDSGSASQLSPAVWGDYIVWVDTRNGDRDIYGYRVSTFTEFPIAVEPGSDQQEPVIADNIVAWRDNRSGNFDIYAYDLANPTSPFKVNKDTGSANQGDQSVSGDYIVWSDNRNGNYDIYVYKISTDTEFQISTSPEDETQATVAGDYVAWVWIRWGWQYEVKGYEISTGTPFPVNTDSTFKKRGRPHISGNIIVWDDYRSSESWEVYSYNVGTATEARVSRANQWFDDLLAGVDSYDVVLFCDYFQGMEKPLALFDAADAAGVSILGIGTEDTGYPIGAILTDDSRYGLETDYANATHDMEIDVTASGKNHPIFSGINTSGTIALESGGGENDEQYYNSSGPDKPADWSVLATLGPNMGNAGNPAIVEFTTPRGTHVILDGSANTYDGYDYWTQTRWDLLYNEVKYLAGK